ncbi:AcrR family transcriptional regulator [Paenibacillus phyllosphaerae]|uniref:AcrR family transcriptional regulator n=1 Tax=Paenibacillus phyllosphaerae TaxID=274593 RepID=A0A7W5B034_9BACL|nr:TetR/AcrR family transcriptional regulator [Paenibacillus phyllosphaerae]MBB3111893.1 AcrR family transcriptional regulator [Paenibacillus phyllosphaerae]
MAAIDRRSLILKAATQAFAQFGYKATTMDLVSKIANVGKGTIYTFFKTKEELFDEIVRKALHELQVVLDEGMHEGEPFFDNLFRVLSALLEFRSDHELFIKLQQEVQHIGTSQALEGTHRLEGVVLDYLRGHIVNGIEKGEIKPCDPDIVAYTILKLYIALTSDWNKFHKEPLTKEQIQQHFILFFAEGLRYSG